MEMVFEMVRQRALSQSEVSVGSYQQVRATDPGALQRFS